MDGQFQSISLLIGKYKSLNLPIDYFKIFQFISDPTYLITTSQFLIDHIGIPKIKALFTNKQTNNQTQTPSSVPLPIADSLYVVRRKMVYEGEAYKT